MKKIIYLLLIIILTGTSGCGTIRKVFRLKESSSSTLDTRSTTDSISVRVDKTTTTIRKTADTTVFTPERTVEQKTKIHQDSLIKGMSAIRSDLVDVRLTLDSATGILTTQATIKPQAIPVTIDILQEIRNDIIDTKRQLEQNSRIETSESKSNRVERDPDQGFMWGVVAFLVLLVAGVAVWFFRRR